MLFIFAAQMWVPPFLQPCFAGYKKQSVPLLHAPASKGNAVSTCGHLLGTFVSLLVEYL